MNVYCYFHDPSLDIYPKEIIAQWEKSFADHGFTPRVLTEEDAKKHPAYERVSEFAARMPTVNDPVYERACWLRWCAYSMVAPGLFTDYDVINFGFWPKALIQSELTCLDSGTGPNCIFASKNGVESFIAAFTEDARKHVFRFDGKHHLSDMILFRGWFSSPPFVRQLVCWGMEHPDADTALLRHFSNWAMAPEYKFNNRYLFIEQALKKAAQAA